MPAAAQEDRERIGRNLARLRAEIEAAGRGCGRDPATINLLVVTKTVDAAAIGHLAALGQRHVGENRVPAAGEKIASLAGQPLVWHMVGAMQRKRAKKAVELFDWIHSLDSVKLAAELDRRAGEAGRRPKVFLEVNTSGEAAKHGVAPGYLEELVRAVAGLDHLEAVGLMTMGPLDPDPETARPCFRRLRELRDRFAGEGLGGELSMGMSGDFPIAIEEGATWLRVGTAVFK